MRYIFIVKIAVIVGNNILFFRHEKGKTMTRIIIKKNILAILVIVCIMAAPFYGEKKKRSEKIPNHTFQ